MFSDFERMICRTTLLISLFLALSVEANFEDSRCRCTCPSTESFSSSNTTANPRRYYTKTNLPSSICTPQNVVKQSVKQYVDEAHTDAFLANCDCRYESRNTVLLKVVVIFFICVLALLGSYMLFLSILDPMFKRRRASVNYRRQEDDMEENIFAQSGEPTSSTIPMQTQQRSGTNILEKIEVAQSNWQHNVDEQRRKVLEEHSVLN
ncbi:hypothetical protein M3Y97_00523600 [Aphelenchoides bicaudatus]|nr:hypothetical protein M3Y97_00523600 [Aphelenchoides bicaudatus]